MKEREEFEKKIMDAKEKIDRANEQTRDRLIKFCQTKVRTTMIGALAAFEKNFSEMMDSLEERDSEKIKECFTRTRESILDLGNQQIRGIDHEIKKHDVSKRVYSVIFKVKGDQE